MKIINIASSDSFEDIIEAVNESEAEKLVLVVPRSNRVFKSKNRVGQLKEHFGKAGKQVSIMSSGEMAVENARLAGFEIVSSERSRTRNKSATSYGINEKEKTVKPSKDEEIVNLYSEKSTWEEPKLFPPEIKPAGSKKFIVIFLAAAILSFLFTISFAFNQAKIRIVPQKDEFSVSIPITVSTSIIEPDPIYGLVPGQTVQFEKEIVKTFPATGEKEIFQKAKGKITIYNNYSGQPQILVATTRFQTSEGLVFRILQRVIVPGSTGSGDNFKPGKIEVEAIADRAGAEYNLGPSEFRIPGFLGSPRYQGFYAESSESFSGGFIGKAKVATKEDIDTAEKSIREELSNEIKSHLAGLSGLKIITGAFEIEIEKTPDSAKANDIAPEFKFGLKAKVFGIAFDESSVKELVSRYVKDSENKNILQTGLELVYSETSLDKEKQELSLKLAASGYTSRPVDKEKMISEIRGKSEKEIRSYFNSLDEVETANIYLSPFWMRSAPKNTERIKVQVVVE